MTKYLFHNVYGDVSSLVASVPGDVVLVPVGPDAATEAARNALLATLGISISAVPALVYEEPARTATRQGGADYTIPRHWVEMRVLDMPRANWEWTPVETERTRIRR